MSDRVAKMRDAIALLILDNNRSENDASLLPLVRRQWKSDVGQMLDKGMKHFQFVNCKIAHASYQAQGN